MKTILFATCVFPAFPSIAQTLIPLFEVAEGKTRTLTVTERNLHIDQLLLGNNCTIVVPPEMDGWTVLANDARIGTGVKILASGVPGIDGGAGFPGANGARGGSKPTGGSIGGRGDNGKPGKNIHLKLHISSLGSLTIISNGGYGGRGGQGGIGGKGADGYCIFSSTETLAMPGQDGASGGPGGLGGNGGDGGNIRIEYRLLPGVQIPDLASRLIVSCAGGTPGLQGKSGAGGTPGKGTRCKGQKSKSGLHGQPGKEWQAYKVGDGGRGGELVIIPF